MEKKVMSMGTVRELTGLTARQIRYYEQRQLIFPLRTPGGMRRYSFSDVERIKTIHQKLQDGFQTVELRKMGQL
ncbi:MerR family transcriptional regulator [Paenibacillus pasadenensis]|uniref:MerR family transcriptional regulator n=1 Tax=Paenibacillus pasadenensis TaxID=217090 RepID=UPI00203A8C69|nr:MerR family transcriptional regulator [Paenibacillus pasadenensis]MCM3749672.1 MerR family transcriptional regulator [Paenibacillus pasadenensis]